tara:strand:- start:619 stop:2775 length:2157 start_codon:yes stop_codon:yes gene_type:complete
MPVTKEVKGNLAKLLATENLTVEHRKVSTASFDVNNRVLILPIWEASETVYDLLVGHEVGHALYTPNVPVHAPKAFVNVIEDARIERLMKQTYPGLRKTFFNGYRELWHQDFFGVSEEDPNNLSLIDRINLYFKGCHDIEFTAEEQIYVNRVENTKTFDDVIELSKELYAYAEDQDAKNEQINLPDMDLELDLPQDSDEQEEVTPDQNGDDLEDSTDDGEEGDGDGGDEDDDDRESYETDLDVPSYKEGNDTVAETDCKTDLALQQAIETLVNDDGRDTIYLELPKLDVDKAIVTWEKCQEDLEYHFYGRAYRDVTEQTYDQGNLEYATDHYKLYKKDAQKSVNYLVKQFEMKKSADEYQRTATSKSGVIDTNSLYKYKLTDDIFRRVQVVPEGKNHGLIFLLDWSGSMQYELLETLKQCYNLIWFCRKVGIPFRVYAFQNGHGNDYDLHPAHVDPKDKTLSLTSDFRLLEFFSSKQNARSLEKSMELVYLQAFAMNNGRLCYDRVYTLGGTPLDCAVLCSRQLVEKLKKIEKVTKVNVVALTDGESNPMTYMVRRSSDSYSYRNTDWHQRYLCHSRDRFILRDPKTKFSKEINAHSNSTTKEIVGFFKEITDYNWIGIRICSKRELQRELRSLSYDEAASVTRQWAKEKYAGVKGSLGFTESFFIPDKNLGIGTQDLEVKQKDEVATKAELNRAFKKHMGSKMANKTILNAFINQIA